MRIVRYLKNSKIAVLLVVALLIVQAFTDLSLPRYTSHIVDVGIQQSGVEHVALDEMRAETFDEVCMLVPAEDEAMVRAAYTETDQGTYKLNDTGRGEIEELDSVMAMPLVVIHYCRGRSPTSTSPSSRRPTIRAPSPKTSFSRWSTRRRRRWATWAIPWSSSRLSKPPSASTKSSATTWAPCRWATFCASAPSCSGLRRSGWSRPSSSGSSLRATAAKIGRGLREKLFKKVVSFSDAEVQSFSAASLITRGTNDIQQIQMVTVMLLRMVLYSPILAIGGIIMVSQTNFAMSWIIVIAVVIIGILVALLMVVAMPKFKIMQKLIDRVNLVSREILTGLPVIRAFDRQRFEEERFDAASTKLMKTQLFTNRVMTFMMPVMMLVMNGISVLIVWVGGSYIDNGTIQTGDLIAFITYSMVIIMSFLMIGMISIMLPRADVAAQRVNEVLDTETTICDPEQSEDDRMASGGGARIAFNDVCFKYEDSSECVLEHVDFTAEPGKTTAIIGSTGSGKSTVIKLIERFYDVTSGSVTIDGVDVRDLSQGKLRSMLGYVPQKAFLFSGTIASNIAYSDEGMSEDSVERAASIAQATEFIDSKEEGFQSDISQGGTNVSGGQRQRLAIARALATGARAFLFDDSFSALDYKTDAALRQALHTQLGEATVVIVAQRISTVLNADQIVVLDEGRVVGKGTHEELMVDCEPYREIALSQLSAAELGGGDAA